MKKARIVPALPEDIIAYDILARLPAGALMRLQCVSRSWRRLISSDPEFQRRQSAHARSSPALVLFGETSRPVFLFRGSPGPWPFRRGGPAGFPSLLDRFPNNERGWLPLTACGGILCAASISEDNVIKELHVGNPVWNDWRPLPPPPSWVPEYSFHKLILAVYETDAGTTAYKLILPFLRDGNNDGKIRAHFLVFSSARGSWKTSEKSVLLDSGRPQGFRLHAPVCVGGVYYWLCLREVLWFDPKEENERAGAIKLPPPDAGAVGLMGEWDGKLSFMRLVRWEMRLWSWSRTDSSWSSSILFTMEAVAKENSHLFASAGLRMNLRNRNADSLEMILGRSVKNVFAFGADFVVLYMRPRLKYLCYDAKTGKAWVLKRQGYESDHFYGPFAYANSLRKLTAPPVSTEQ